MNVEPDASVTSKWRGDRTGISVSSHVLPGVIAGLDSLMVLAAAMISYTFLVGDYPDVQSTYIVAICFIWLVAAMLLNFGGLYGLEPIMRPGMFADKIIVAYATTALFLLAAAFSLKVSADLSRIWLTSFIAGSCAATILARLSAAGILRHLSSMKVFTRNVVVVGAGEQAKKLLTSLEASRPRFISVMGVFADTPNERWTEDQTGYPFLGTVDDLLTYARDHKVDDVVVALPWSADEQILALMNKLKQLPVNVYLGSDLIGFQLPFRSPPDHFGELPVVEVMGRPLAGWGAFQKAALDYSAGPIIAAMLLPLMILIAVAIKLDSKGPVLFRQRRYGFVQRAFYIYKFRTMQHDPAPQSITVQATRNDPRVTRVGRFLRRSSLDELPQLFNVLNGTMSLVGPRPHATDHDESFSQLIRGYFARQRVKPGITGWAQVRGFRGETKSIEDIEARVRYDIEYVENWSLLFDLKILLRTFFICLTGRNAY